MAAKPVLGSRGGEIVTDPTARPRLTAALTGRTSRARSRAGDRPRDRTAARAAYPILDGILIPIDRRADQTVSVKGEPIDAWYLLQHGPSARR